MPQIDWARTVAEFGGRIVEPLPARRLTPSIQPATAFPAPRTRRLSEIARPLDYEAEFGRMAVPGPSARPPGAIAPSQRLLGAPVRPRLSDIALEPEPQPAELPSSFAEGVGAFEGRIVSPAPAVPLTISPSGATALKQREAFRSDPYDDAGGLAIGYGMRTWKGQPVTPDLKVSREEADAEFARQIQEEYAPIVDRALKAPVTQGQYDALLSVAWNRPAVARGIVEKLNRGEVPTLKDFQKEATVRGRRNEGVLARRKQEYEAFIAAADPSMLGERAQTTGLVEPGNIDLVAQPRVRQPDGAVSTVRSISINEDGREVLIPTVAHDGSRILTDDEAIAQYRTSGQHLGIFDSPESATAYAEQLHEAYAAGRYEPAPTPLFPSVPSELPARHVLAPHEEMPLPSAQVGGLLPAVERPLTLAEREEASRIPWSTRTAGGMGPVPAPPPSVIARPERMAVSLDPRRLGRVPAEAADVPRLTTDLQLAEAEPQARSDEGWRRAGLRGGFREPILPMAEAGQAVADLVDEPALDHSEVRAAVDGFVAGSIEGAAQVLEGFTSPLNIGLVAMGTGMGALARQVGRHVDRVMQIQRNVVQTMRRAGWEPGQAVTAAQAEQITPLVEEMLAVARRGQALDTLRRGLRAVEVVAGATFAAEGAQTVLDSDREVAERLGGLAQTAFGAAMTVAGLQGVWRPHPAIREYQARMEASQGRPAARTASRGLPGVVAPAAAPPAAGPVSEAGPRRPVPPPPPVGVRPVPTEAELAAQLERVKEAAARAKPRMPAVTEAEVRAFAAQQGVTPEVLQQIRETGRPPEEPPAAAPARPTPPPGPVSPAAAVEAFGGRIVPPEKHTYSSTQFNLPAEVANPILDLAAKIPDAELGADGREVQPHLTVLYGIESSDAEAVRELLAGEKPFTVKLGKTSIFPASESPSGQDVLKVDVTSATLHRIHKRIADALKTTETTPTYRPHVTVSYLKPGEGAKYAGDESLAGQTVTVDRIVFSAKDGTRTEIPLAAAAREGEPAVEPVRPAPPRGEAGVRAITPVSEPAPAGSPRLNDALTTIRKIVMPEESQIPAYAAVGLRVLPAPVRVGDELPPSLELTDDEPTGEQLKGTSTIGLVDSYGRLQLDQALADLGVPGYSTRPGFGGYSGQYVALVAGESAGSGQDPGEQIIAKAKVLALWPSTTFYETPSAAAAETPAVAAPAAVRVGEPSAPPARPAELTSAETLVLSVADDTPRTVEELRARFRSQHGEGMVGPTVVLRDLARRGYLEQRGERDGALTYVRTEETWPAEPEVAPVPPAPAVPLPPAVEAAPPAGATRARPTFWSPPSGRMSRLPIGSLTPVDALSDLRRGDPVVWETKDTAARVNVVGTSKGRVVIELPGGDRARVPLAQVFAESEPVAPAAARAPVSAEAQSAFKVGDNVTVETDEGPRWGTVQGFQRAEAGQAPRVNIRLNRGRLYGGADPAKVTAGWKPQVPTAEAVPEPTTGPPREIAGLRPAQRSFIESKVAQLGPDRAAVEYAGEIREGSPVGRYAAEVIERARPAVAEVVESGRGPEPTTRPTAEAREEPTGVLPERPRPQAPGTIQPGRVPASVAARRATVDAEARQSAADALFARVAADAREQGYTGTDGDLRRLYDERIEFLRAGEEALEGSGRDPRTLLQEIANAGGIGNDPSFPGEARWLREEADLDIRGRSTGRTMLGIAGVFNRRGGTLSDMVEHLGQYRHFDHIETVNDLIEEMVATARGSGSTQPLTLGELRHAGIERGTRWWEETWDTSFEPSTLEPPTELADLLDTIDRPVGELTDAQLEQERDALTAKDVADMRGKGPALTDAEDARRKALAGEHFRRQGLRVEVPSAGGPVLSQHDLGNAGVLLEDGAIQGVHVTSEPKRVAEAVRSAAELWRSYGREAGDLGPGLYISATPQLWMGRARGKWDFTTRLTDAERTTIAEAIRARLAEDRQTHYITASELETAERFLKHWEDDPKFIDSAVMLSDQPYNLRWWEPAFLEPLGITPGTQPTQVNVVVKGRFYNAGSGMLSAEQATSLREQGYDGAFNRGGMVDVPQLVVWNRSAVVKAGDVVPAVPVEDILETGEVQPRLPEAGAVRDQEQPTPSFEAPFSLTPEAAEAGAVQPSMLGALEAPSLSERTTQTLDTIEAAARKRLKERGTFLPSAAKIAGGVKIGTDPEALGRVLGSSLYQGDFPKVATKELLQNALDAIRDIPNGTATVTLLADPNSYGLSGVRVEDTGRGMTREEVETVFTDLGASGKRAQEAASGGFGLAKAAPLLGGRGVRFSTVSASARGWLRDTRTRYAFEGSPDQLLKGVPITSSAVREATGTTVEVDFPESASSWIVDAYLESLVKYSPALPGQLKIQHGAIPQQIEPFDRSAYAPSVTFEVPGAVVELLTSRLVHPTWGSNLQIANNGIHQFEAGRVHGVVLEQLPLPDHLVVDLHPTVEEGHRDYPFTANREALRDAVTERLRNELWARIVDPVTRRAKTETQQLYDSAESATLPNGQRWSFLDASGTSTLAELQQIAGYDQLAAHAAAVVDEVLTELLPSMALQQVERRGFIFAGNLHGIFMENPGEKDRYSIYVNPVSWAAHHQTPDGVAGGLLHTIVHEAVHHAVSSHSEGFTVALSRAYAALGAKRYSDALQRLRGAYADPDNPDTLSPTVTALLDAFDRSRRPEAGEGTTLARLGVFARSEGPEGPTEGARPDVSGTRPGTQRAIPAEDVADLVLIGAAKLGKGTIQFAEWSRQMIAEAGEQIRPHLQAIYDQAQERLRTGPEFQDARPGEPSILGEGAEPEADLVSATPPTGSSENLRPPRRGGGAGPADIPQLITETGPFEQRSATVPTGQTQTLRPIPPVELTRLVVKLLGGNRIFLKRYPKARGHFYAGEEPRIGLHPELGQDYEQFAKTLAHEAGHLVDFLPEGELGRGNILGRIASLRRYLRTTIDGLPTDPTNALTPKDRKQFRRRAEQETGPKPPKDNETDLAAWREEVARRYREIVEDEIEARGLIGRERVQEELLALSQWWRPYDPDTATLRYLDYRASSKELYADAVSVLLNSPGSLQERAPIFFDAVLAYMERKPEVRAEYEAIQDLLSAGAGEIAAQRTEEWEAGFARGEKILREAADPKPKQPLLNYLRQLFLLRGAPLYAAEFRRVKGEPAWSPQRTVKMALQEFAHADNVNTLTLLDFQKIHQSLTEAAIAPEQFGQYLALQRIAEGDRGGTAEDAKQLVRDITGKQDWAEAKAAYQALPDADPDLIQQAESGLINPYGYTPAEARAQIDGLKNQVGDAKFRRMGVLATDFRQVFWPSIEEAVRVGVYNQETFSKKIEPNRDSYVPYAVLDYFTGHVSGTVRRQVGTVKGIANPYVTMLLKTMALNRLVERQKAALAVLDVLDLDFPGMAREARPIDQHHREQHPRSGRANLRYFVDGKLHYREVDEYIAKVLESQDIGSLTRLSKLLSSKTYGFFHPLYVSWSIAWQTRNLPRDWKRTYNLLAAAHRGQPTYRQAIEAVLDIGRLNRDYLTVIGQAASQARRRPDAVIRQMLADRALGRAFHSFHPNPEADTDVRLLQRAGIMAPEATGVGRYLEAVGSPIEAFGVFQETWAKAAAFKYYGDRGVTGRERAYLVRNYAGTPDSLERGLASEGVNGLYMYANVQLSGLRTAAEVGLDPKTAPGYWFRSVLIDFAPKMIAAAALLGWMGKELKDWMDRIPSYDLEKYIVIPVYPFYSENEAGEKKAVYLKFPHEDSNRMIAAAVWTLLMHQGPYAASRALGVIKGEFPGLQPGVDLLNKWIQFWSGRNPYDEFRGGTVVPRTEWEAGGWDRVKEMLRYTMGEFGIISQILGRWIYAAPDEHATDLERLVRSIPGISSLVRITDRGLDEKRWWEEDIETQARAQLRADLPLAVRRAVSERSRLNRFGEPQLSLVERRRRRQLNEWYRSRYVVTLSRMERAKERGDQQEYQALIENIGASVPAIR